MDDWIGASWTTIGWVALTTTAIYVTTVVSVRVAGRRTLAEISAFDIVVTIALGSIVATTAVQKDASYLQGATAVVTLLVLQTVVAAIRQKVPAARRLLDFRPEVVIRDGELSVSAHPLGAQLTETEVRSQLRQHGVFDPARVAVAVVEPGGALSVAAEGVDPSTIDDLRS